MSTETRRNPLLEVVLSNRGYTDEFLEDIENPEHGDLLDVRLLSNELKAIHDDGTPITIYPDFDMDGIMSGTILYAGLSELGFDVELFVPDPSAGYGITPSSIDDLMSKHPRTKAIITCDTGITANKGVKHANELGVKVLITDHHTQGKEGLPDAVVVVDPMRNDDPYAHPEICGAFVAYQCLMDYAKAYGSETDVIRINRLRVFAGVGTVSDQMPLRYENRLAVREMVTISKWLYGDATAANANKMPGCEPYRKAFRGLHLTLMGLLDNGNLRNGADSIDEQTIGFYIAPMFNSIKRLDGDLSRAFGVFFGDQQVSDIDYLIRLNEQRKRIVAAEYSRLPERFTTDPTTGEQEARLVYVTDAKPGVMGLLAAKVLGETGEPAFVVAKSKDAYSGSGRCPEWFPALKLLRDGLGYKLSGHQGAFGLRIPAEIDGEFGPDRFERDAREISAKLKAEGLVQEAVPDFSLKYDMIGDAGTDGSDVDWDSDLLEEFVDQVDDMRPFGSGFPEPSGLLTLEFSTDDVMSIGRDGTHAKMQANGVDVLCWGQYDRFAMLPEGTYEVSILGSLSLNEFRGNRTPSFAGDIVRLTPVDVA